MAMRVAAGLRKDWYTPEDQRDLPEGEKPTRFLLQGLLQIDLLEVMSEGDVLSDGSFVPNHRGRLLLIRQGLKGWEEVYDADGQPTAFSLSAANNLPAQLLGEISNELMMISVITEEEKKS